MADIEHDEIDDTYDDQERSNAEWAALRKEKKARREAEEKAAAAQREIAFYKAGIPSDDPKFDYFRRGYEGEATPEAIRQAAIEAGFMQAQQAQPQSAQVQAQQRIAMAGAAGTPPEAGPDAALSALDEAYQQGGVAAVLAAMQQAGIPMSSQG